MNAMRKLIIPLSLLFILSGCYQSEEKLDPGFGQLGKRFAAEINGFDLVEGITLTNESGETQLLRLDQNGSVLRAATDEGPWTPYMSEGAEITAFKGGPTDFLILRVAKGDHQDKQKFLYVTARIDDSGFMQVFARKSGLFTDIPTFDTDDEITHQLLRDYETFRDTPDLFNTDNFFVEQSSFRSVGSLDSNSQHNDGDLFVINQSAFERILSATALLASSYDQHRESEFGRNGTASEFKLIECTSRETETGEIENCTYLMENSIFNAMANSIRDIDSNKLKVVTISFVPPNDLDMSMYRTIIFQFVDRIVKSMGHTSPESVISSYGDSLFRDPVFEKDLYVIHNDYVVYIKAGLARGLYHYAFYFPTHAR